MLDTLGACFRHTTERKARYILNKKFELDFLVHFWDKHVGRNDIGEGVTEEEVTRIIGHPLQE